MRQHNGLARRLLSLLLALLLAAGLAPMPQSAAAADAARAVGPAEPEDTAEPEAWTDEREVEDADYTVSARAPLEAFDGEAALFAALVEWEDLDEVYRTLLEREKLTGERASLLDIGVEDRDGDELEPARPVEVSIRIAEVDEEASVDVYRIVDLPRDEEEARAYEALPEEEREPAALELVASTDSDKLAPEDETEEERKEREESDLGKVFMEDGAARALFEEERFSLYLIYIVEPEREEEPAPAVPDREPDQTPAPAVRVITFHGAGGTLEDGSVSYTQTAPADGDTVLEPARFARPGYVFEGWAASVLRSSPDYEDGAALPAGGDVELYASWRELTPETEGSEPEPTPAPVRATPEPTPALGPEPELVLAPEPEPEPISDRGGVLVRAEVLGADTPITSGEGQVLSGGVYYLDGDVTVTGADMLNGAFLTIESDATVTLYLNGHTIDVGQNGRAIYVDSGATLILCDQYGTSGDTGGKITNASIDGDGGGVYVTDGGSFTMVDGTLAQNSAGQNGGGVYVAAGGSFTIVDGALAQNSAGQNGGGLYVDEGAEVLLNGGTIGNNTASCGGGAYIADGGTLEVDGGTLGENTASSDGGGVYIGGELTLSDGAIQQNTASVSGGGAYIADGGTFTFSGGALGENAAAQTGGGVYVGGALRLSGSPAIVANTVGDAANNIYLPRNKVITVTGALSSAEKLGVTMENSGVFTSGYDRNNSAADPWEKFVSDDGLGIRWSDTTPREARMGGGLMKFSGGGRLYSDGNPAELTSGIYYLTADVTASSVDAVTSSLLRVAADAEVTLYLDGYTLSGYSMGRVLYVPSGTTLHLFDAYNDSGRTGGTITGGGRVAEGGGAYVAGTMNMSGVAITGNIAGGSGGGVCVDGGSLSMQSGSVELNQAANGAGLYVKNGGVLAISGGAVSGNVATGGGGGVLVEDGSLTLSAGRIGGNVVRARGGGGVEVFEAGSFAMSGGTVELNQAAGSGGGVYVADGGAMTLTGGAIQNNTASVSGGGVYVDGALTMEGAPVVGGNVTGGTISDGALSGGTAGNIYLAANKRITITGALTYTDAIGVSAAAGGAFTDGYGIYNTDDPWEKFTPEQDIYGLGWTAEDPREAMLGGGLMMGGGGGRIVTTGASVTLGSGDYYLTANVTWTSGTGSEFLSLAPGAAVTLYLNGYTLDLDRRGRLVRIDEGRTFTLSSEYTGGTGTGASQVTGGSAAGGGAVYVNGGAFEITGGMIRGCQSSEAGGAVYVNSGTFEMTGGTVTYNTAETEAGGVYVAADGAFDMNDGTISNNTAQTEAGGVYVAAGGAFDMSGGTISNNTASYGGGVSAGGVFSLSGGTISNNVGSGGGVYIPTSGTMTMTGGTIQSNTASGNGGGVYVAGTLKLSSGTIQQNTAASGSSGGGVYADGTFELSGGPRIADNVNGGSVASGALTGGTADNVYLPDGACITIAGTLTNEERIGVAMPSPGVFTSGYWTYNSGTQPSVRFASDRADYEVARSAANEAMLLQKGLIRVEGGNVEFITDGDAVTLGSGTYYLTKDVTARGLGPNNAFLNIEENATVKLILNGYILGGGTRGRVVCVGSGATLELYDAASDDMEQNGLTITRNSRVPTFTCTVNAVTNETADIEGGQITGGIAAEGGAGVYVSGGTLRLHGGVVCGNAASAGGAGVRIEGGTLEMDGGCIAGNASSAEAGGVYVTGGTFTMTGGTVAGNTADTTAGGVGVAESGTFTMRGGAVSGNTAQSGGGVFVTGGNGEIYMSGGTIRGNAADTTGGGICAAGGGSILISGDALIEENTSAGEGGGVAMTGGGTLTITGGAIRQNTAQTTGGGVDIGPQFTGTATISGGTVTGNSAQSGGGVSRDGAGGTVTLSGGAITGNTAEDSGGGVYVNGTLRIAGAPTVTDNTVSDAANNLYLPGDQVLTIAGALTNTTKLGVTMQTAGTFTSGYSSANSAVGPWDKFASDDMNYGILLSDGEAALAKGLVHESGRCITAGAPATLDEGGNYYLTADVEAESVSGGTFLTLGADVTAGLYLNGYTLDAEALGRVITVPADTSLTLYTEYRGSGRTGGTITGGRAAQGGGVYVGGAFTMTAGTISENEATEGADEDGGGGVYVAASGQFNMTGGVIESNESACDGGGVKVYNGTLTLNGGTIRSNNGQAGAGVDVYGGELKLLSGTVGGNMATGSGGGLRLYSGGTAEMSGDSAAITGNKAPTGGGVYVDAGTFTMTGGSVQYNTAATGDGGGVYVDDGGTFDLRGGSVRYNTAAATGSGGGVYAGGAFELSGDPTLSDNRSGARVSGGGLTGGTDNNVYLPEGKVIDITGALSMTAKIQILMEDPDNGIFTSGYKTSGNTAAPSTYFMSGHDQYVVDWSDTEEAMLVRFGLLKDTEHGGEFITDGDPATLDSGTYYLTADVTARGVDDDHSAFLTIAAGADVKLYLNGRTLSAGGLGRGVYIAEGATVELCGALRTTDTDGGTLSGGDLSGDGAGVYTDGTLVISAGGISGNRARYGGGVYVGGTGALEMSGGSISGNRAGAGGGVYVANGGSFTLEGGTVSGNTAPDGSGGGVYAAGTFTMSGASTPSEDPVVGGNSAQSGGGVYAAGDGSLTLTGGTIRNNEAASGGGVYTAAASSVTGGTISNNSAASGGGMYVSGAMALGGGAIRDNTASGDGGGVLVDGGDGVLTMTGGTIRGNAADTIGGGICEAGDGSISISGDALIEENTSAGWGGGVAMTGGGTLTITGGMIQGNTAQSGGGVNIGTNFSGTATISGGTITGNTTTRGGGIFRDGTGGTVTLSGGAITGNTAEDSGGGVYVNGPLQLSGAPTVTGNTVSDAANNLYLPEDQVLTIAGALTNAAKLGVTMQTAGTFTSGYSSANSAVGPWDKFASDDMNYGILLSDGEAALAKGLVHESGRCITAGAPATLDEDGNYYLTADVTANSVSSNNFISLARGAQVTLYLNGYALSADGRGRVVYVPNGAALDVYDGESGGTLGLIYSDSPASHSYVIDAATGEETTYTGGAITGGRVSGNAGGAGVLVSGGTLRLHGGAIRGNVASAGGAGVRVNGGALEMDGGHIVGNTSSAEAGGVYVTGGTFTMTGGTVAGNTADTTAGGVGVAGSGMFNLRGGAVSGNTAQSGGGVSRDGTGGTVTLSGGAITGNTAEDSGGGVYVNGTLRLSGAPTVADNTVSGAANNLYLPEDRVLTIAGALEEAARVYVTMRSPGVFTEGYSLTNERGPWEPFRADKWGYGIRWSDDEREGQFASGLISSDGEFITEGAPVTLESGTYYLAADVTAKSVGSNSFISLEPGARVTLYLNGYALSADGKGRVVYVPNGAALDVYDGEGEDGTLGLIYSDSPASHSYVIDAATGETDTYTGGAITGGRLSGNEGGAGVNVVSGGILRLHGGAIRGNAASAGGAGVRIEGGTLEMDGGYIVGNTSSAEAGGVYVTGGTMTMSGGTVAGNTADATAGGVYIVSGGELLVSGEPVVTGNALGANSTTHNVYLPSGSVITVAGSLEETARIGVRMETPGVFTSGYSDKAGAIDPWDAFVSDDLSYGIALNDGGEAHLRQGLLQDNGRFVTVDQPVTLTGGTYYLTADVVESEAQSDTLVTILGGETVSLYLNGWRLDANERAGAVYIDEDATLALYDAYAPVGNRTGGSLRGGSASDGGGVFINGRLELHGGTICGNTAEYNGGGVYVNASGVLELLGGAIQSNTAGNNGGGVYVLGTVNLSGDPAVRGNVVGGRVVNGAVAGGSENDIYLTGGKKLNIVGPLTNNSAEKIGVVMYRPGVFTEGYAEANTEDPSGYFRAENGSYDIIWNSEKTEAAFGGRVVYMANNNIDGPYTEYMNPGEDYTVKSVGTGDGQIPFTAPTGKMIASWNTQPNGTGTMYAEGQIIPAEEFTAGLTLYAQWRMICYVTYYPNGGSPNQTIIRQVPEGWYTIEGCDYTAPNDQQRFRCWNTAADGGGDSYFYLGTVYLTGNLDLYAQWADRTELYAGGLVGYAEKSLNVDTSFAATVAKTKNTVNGYAGGLVGYVEGNLTIEDSYAACYLGGDYIGGFAGMVDGVLTTSTCYTAGFPLNNPFSSQVKAGSFVCRSLRAGDSVDSNSSYTEFRFYDTEDMMSFISGANRYEQGSTPSDRNRSGVTNTPYWISPGYGPSDVLDAIFPDGQYGDWSNQIPRFYYD